MNAGAPLFLRLLVGCLVGWLVPSDATACVSSFGFCSTERLENADGHENLDSDFATCWVMPNRMSDTYRSCRKRAGGVP